MNTKIRSRISRREFLEKMARSGLSIGAVALGHGFSAAQGAARPAPPANLRLRSQGIPSGLVSPNDFTYIGSFKLPPDCTYGGMGLEFYPEGNGGAGSLFVGLQRYTDYPNTFCEVSIPTPYNSPTRLYSDLPSASIVRTEFDPTGGILPAYLAEDPDYHKSVIQGVGIVNIPGKGKKLFWAWHGWYTLNPIYTIGYCDLDPNPAHAVVSNPRGPWNFSGVNPAKFSNTIWNVPQAWADLYAGGRSVGVGGLAYGHFVSESSGGYSAYYFAPWIDDPTNAAPAALSSISYRKAQGYTGTEHPEPTGMVYPSKLVTMGFKPPPDGDHPGGYNYFWSSEFHSGMRWITTSDNRVGLVGVSSIGGKWSCYDQLGYTYIPQADHWQYVSWPWPRQGPNGYAVRFPCHQGRRGPVCGFWRPAMMFFDPADHAAVLQGSKQPNDIIAYDIRSLWYDLAGPNGKYDWYVDDDGNEVCYDGAARDNKLYCNWGGAWTLGGAAFDPDTRRYYVLQAQVAKSVIGDEYPVVHVYQVA